MKKEIISTTEPRLFIVRIKRSKASSQIPGNSKGREKKGTFHQYKNLSHKERIGGQYYHEGMKIKTQKQNAKPLGFPVNIKEEEPLALITNQINVDLEWSSIWDF